MDARGLPGVMGGASAIIESAIVIVGTTVETTTKDAGASTVTDIMSSANMEGAFLNGSRSLHQAPWVSYLAKGQLLLVLELKPIDLSSYTCRQR
jgi:hypothetical protein